MREDDKIQEFSLLGGPLHRLGSRLGLVRGGTNTIQLGLALGLLAWGVLIVMGLLQGSGHKIFSLALIGGWSLYAKGGKLKYCYNVAGVHHFFAESAEKIPAGKGEIGGTQAMVFSADDGCDVGEDTGAPVSLDYGPQGNAFNGTVKGVQLAIAEAAEDVDHLVNPEDAIRVAMARQ